jgi:PAS domain S-box-containing protein
MTRMTPLSRVIGGAGAAAAAALGAASFVAWWIGGWRMARLGPDGIPMGPITSVLFVSLGLSVAALMLRPDSRAARAAGLLISFGAFVASGLAAAQFRSHFRLPWDGWLIGSETMVGTMPLGRMSPLTVIVFLFTSVALFTQLVRARDHLTFRWIAVVAATLGLVIGLEVIAAHVTGTPRSYGGQTTPMATLTAAAFAFLNLALLLRSALSQLVLAWLKPDGPGETRRFQPGEIPALGLMIGLIAFAGLFYLRREQTVAREAVHQQLDAVANLKAEQITAWRSGHLGEAGFLLRTREVARELAALVARPSGAPERARLVDWLEPIRGGMRYESVLVYDQDARLLLAIPESTSPPSALPLETFRQALGSPDVVFTDLYADPKDASIRLDLLVPIRPRPARATPAGARGSTPPIAVIVLRLDPAHSLFRQIKEWPVPSDSAETLLVRRDGDDVIYLSDLKYRPGAALTLRRSLKDPYLPAAMGLRGDPGIREGLDYRGTSVIATSRSIPGSAWILEVKVDRAEAYEPIRREAWQTGALVSLLMLALVLAGAFFSWRRRSDFLHRALVAEQDRNAMAERLGLLTRHASDIIVLTDEAGRVLEANDRALATYGYSLEELRALPSDGLRLPEAAAGSAEQLSLIEQTGRSDFETLHRRKDGSVFPVDVSGRAVMIGVRRHLLWVIRDITHRNTQAAEIRRLNRLYAAHSQVNQAIVHATTREALLNDVCRCLVLFGRFPMAWVAWRNPTTGIFEPVADFGDTSGYLKNLKITPEGSGPVATSIRQNRVYISNDFLADSSNERWHDAAAGAGFLAAIALPVRAGNIAAGTLVAYAGEVGFFGPEEVALLEEAALDIAYGLSSLDRESDRARAEAALSKSEERLRLALTAGHQALYDLNLQTGEATVDPEYATMLGYDPKSFRETTAAWLDRLHPDDREPVTRVFEDYLADRRPDYLVEFRDKTKSGDWAWILSVGRIVERTEDGKPLRLLGTRTDVTELKRAQAAVVASELRYRRLFESSKDGILILDASTGMVVDVNPFLVELLGFSREAFFGKAIWDLGFFRDIVANQESFAELQAQEYIRYEDKPLETVSGRRIDVEFVSNLYLVNDRKVIQCNIRDITERRQADEALRASLREKEALLKEVHHRVKNNLQVIASLLRLETGRSEEPGTKRVLKDMQGRIRSMALLHEALYRSGTFSRVDLAEYLGQLATQLFRGQNTEPAAVSLVLELASAKVAIDQAIPCGLITNELISNSLKHAFPGGRTGEVRVDLRWGAEGRLELRVCDTGVGLPEDFEARRAHSLGLQLVSDLAKQLAGEFEIGPPPRTLFAVSFTPHASPAEEVNATLMNQG